jgi:hypothetical protein
MTLNPHVASSKVPNPTPNTIEGDFSDEILDYIVSFVDRATLPSLSVTSKTLNRLATPQLYSHINLTENIELYPLAYLLVTSPAHASYVQSLVVTESWQLEANAPDESKPWNETKSSQREEKMLRREYARYATNDTQADELYDKIRPRGNQDAMLALMIAHLPNLQKLDIDFGMLDDHNHFHEVLRLIAGNEMFPASQHNGTVQKTVESAQKSHSIVPKRLHVLIKGTDDKYPNDSCHVATWFHLPNLHSFYACKFGDSELDLGENQKEPFARLEPRSDFKTSQR